MSHIPKYNFFHRIYLAITGILYAVYKERHLKFHLFFGGLLLIPMIWISVPLFQAILLVIMIGLLICMELINTVIELIVDMITTDYNINAKLAKDISSGAVLIVASLTLILGMFIYWPSMYTLFRSLFIGH